MRDDDTVQLLELLNSPSSIDRLRAARALAKQHVDAAAIQAVGAILEREPDAWVQNALKRIVGESARRQGSPLEQAEQGNDIGTATDSRTLEDVRAQAVARVTRTILHEIRPLVGYVDSAAARDIAQYDSSRTAAEIERLRAFLSTVERLSAASRPPEPSDFDLTAAVLETVESIAGDRDRLLVARNDPVPARGDWGLVQIALVNGLRNALEATAEKGGRIVVNWGSTDRDYWVAILDDGTGLPEGRELFTPGFTTKSRKTNSGWGLAIAEQAITSAGGEISLRPRDSGGTAFEIRWLRGVENP